MIRYLALATLAFPIAAIAAPLPVVDSCPSIGGIEHEAGTYRARTESGNWFGLASGDGSGDVASFDEAIFYPDSAQSTEGRLNKCSYRLATGVVDLTLEPGSGDPRATLVGSGNWQYDLLFGEIPIAFCSGVPERCTFRLK